MRHVFAAIVIAATFGTAAHAADLPPQMDTRAPARVVAERFSWTGFYIGANAGYGFGKISNIAGTASDSMSGPIAGAQIGGNLQTGAFVFGVEADFQGSWQDNTFTVLGVTVKEEIPWFGTLRARAGVAFDRTLIYLTGGGAYTNFELSGTAGGVTVTSNTSHAAWTVGAGVEQMFLDRWSAKLEYLYIDTGNVNTTLFGVPVSGRLTDNIVRAGINYHF
jgi:outer membrane immunogenic protein